MCRRVCSLAGPRTQSPARNKWKQYGREGRKELTREKGKKHECALCPGSRTWAQLAHVRLAVSKNSEAGHVDVKLMESFAS